LNDELLAKAEEYTGISDKSALIREALPAFLATLMSEISRS
jgi:hypothetical protein